MNGARSVVSSRKWMRELGPPAGSRAMEAEGGCGVVGLVSTRPVAGRHIHGSLVQMHNRGNGKGGGIAAVGLSPEQMGVGREVLENDYLVQVAYLKPGAREELESEHLRTAYRVDASYRVETSEDPELMARLEVPPPEVWRYFCRAREDALSRFISENSLESLDRGKAEDEFVYQTSFRINSEFYVTRGMSAFVMSHGRNMMVLKIVGYAEDVISYYKLEEVLANIWIGHQRYPTKGRVWHPGGAHPFVGLDEALVHNGDFANYHTVSEYLGQRNIVPLFLTDTEVAVLLYDLLSRVYEYPLEYIIEALAPTTERDFFMLPKEKQDIYRAIQATHIHGSPDGPWFFIIGKNDFHHNRMQLMGITDTSMLRPQVFALVDGEVQLGLIASEKQAIDSTLESISEEFPSVPHYADKYWNARGGSHNFGGAFIFSLYNEPESPDGKRLICTSKFGKSINPPDIDWDHDHDLALAQPIPESPAEDGRAREVVDRKNPEGSFKALLPLLDKMSGEELNNLFGLVVRQANGGDVTMDEGIQFLTLMLDRRFHTGRFRASRLAEKVNEAVNIVLRRAPRMDSGIRSIYKLVDFENRHKLVAPRSPYDSLVLDCRDFPMEGEEGVSFVIRGARELGWNRVLLFDMHGQRFVGCGLGPKTKGLRVDVYGSPGDYLGSGLDGAEVYVHSSGQDQLGQIMSDGRLVVYGNVGQTFLYGAKGGEAYVMGNAAGRPLINAVGRPKIIINGTCLDYLAESFMAGNPLYGGGFAVLNGIEFDDRGRPVELPEPYPGGNLFSLASGGAIYVRDPRMQVGEDQLNGGRISKLAKADWELLLPYLKENERLFGISVEDFLLKVDGVRKPPEEVYRKIEAVPLITLSGKTRMQDIGE